MFAHKRVRPTQVGDLRGAAGWNSAKENVICSVYVYGGGCLGFSVFVYLFFLRVYTQL